MQNKQIGTLIIRRFFPDQSAIQLWESCPCKMLWEALKRTEVTIINENEVPHYLQTANYVYVLPECLPAVYLGVEPAYMILSDFSLLHFDNPPYETKEDNKTDFLQIEPLYIINGDFSWMVVLTTENLPSGDRLCAYVEADFRKNLGTQHP